MNYVKYIIEPILRQNKKGRAGHDGQNEFTKLSFSILDKVRIPIPIKPDGMYDEAAQKDIAQKYNCYMRLRIILLKKIGSIINTRIEIAG